MKFFLTVGFLALLTSGCSVKRATFVTESVNQDFVFEQYEGNKYARVQTDPFHIDSAITVSTFHFAHFNSGQDGQIIYPLRIEGVVFNKRNKSIYVRLQNLTQFSDGSYIFWLRVTEIKTSPKNGNEKEITHDSEYSISLESLGDFELASG